MTITVPETSEQAIALGETEFWKELSHEDIAAFQLRCELLCMPFDVLHEAVEKTLRRPVWSHEFANPQRLIEEMEGQRPMATLDEVLDLIPDEKRIVVIADDPVVHAMVDVGEPLCQTCEAPLPPSQKFVGLCSQCEYEGFEV